ncbi:histone H1 [bacterium]|nr:histone H1 [bacterium]
MIVVAEEMKIDNELWSNKGNKAAAGRMRKATLVLAKLGKEFRTLSVAEAKEVKK